MLETLMDRFGDGTVLFVGGVGVGALFGAAAQHSRFCLRAATVELAALRPGGRLAVWLLAFLSAVAAVQFSVAQGWIVLAETRQIGAVGSLSGAVIGGLLFGAGMILARGCASRLLVLSATGNLRALLTGLVLTIVAQASLSGALSGPREALTALWLVPPGTERDLGAWLGQGPDTLALVAAGGLGVALLIAIVMRVPFSQALAAALVGVAIALGWLFTFAALGSSFEPLQPTSITFTGPSADTLMAFVSTPAPPLEFNTGLVPGVFLGAGLAAFLTGEVEIQGFEGGPSMLRYLAGAVAMGFGGMLAGGCAVGAGLTGGALMSTTAWVALTAMWVGAMATHSALQARSPMAAARAQ